jgi:hypothetical protein
MANYSQISWVVPFRFVPNNNTSIHFGYDWACLQIKPFERNVHYIQKWLRQTTTKIQCQSTIAPQPIVYYNHLMQNVKNTAWANVSGVSGLNIYEVEIDFSDLPEGVYALYQNFELLSYKKEFISELIESRNTHQFVKRITYKNSNNVQDIIWSTGIEMTFCIECEIMNMKPEADISSYADQTRDITVLDGIPYRTYSLEFFDAAGGAPYMLDIINRIFCLDKVKIEGLNYSRNIGAKLSVNQIKGYPLVGGSLEITESANLYSLQQNDVTALAPGIVTAYNIDTGWFSGANIVQIELIQSP